MAGHETTKKVDNYLQGVDINPLHWPHKLAQDLGLAPGDQPGTSATVPQGHHLMEDPGITRRNPRFPDFEYDPVSGQYYDVTTGTPQGLQNPNVAQLVAGSNLRSHEHDTRALGYGARESDIFGQQSDLAGYLNDVIAGKTPSVAEMQLGAGLDSIKRSTLGLTSGIGGATSPLAQITALNANSRAGGIVNQQQAIARAEDVARARNELAQLLNAQQQSSMGQQQNEENLGFQYGDQALRGESAQQNLTLAGDAAGAKGTASVLKGLAEAYGVGNKSG